MSNLQRLSTMAFITAMLVMLVGCGASEETVSKEKYTQTEADLMRKEKELQDKTVEMLDLKNQITILKSEVEDLEKKIATTETEKSDLRKKLADQEKTTEILEQELTQVEKEKDQLLEEKEALESQINQDQTSLRSALESSAQSESKRRLESELDALDIIPDTETPAADEDTADTQIAGTESSSTDTDELEPVPEPDDDEAAKTDTGTKALTEAMDQVMKPSPDEYHARYENALNEYFNDNYIKAIEEFQTLIQIDSQNDYADNCQYWIGECYYSQGKYDDAVHAFQEVLDFQDSNKADHAQFKIGLSYRQLGNQEAALRAFRTLITDYPQSSLVDKVKEMIENNSL